MRTTTAAFFRSSHFISATAAGEYQNCHQQKNQISFYLLHRFGFLNYNILNEKRANFVNRSQF